LIAVKNKIKGTDFSKRRKIVHFYSKIYCFAALERKEKTEEISCQFFASLISVTYLFLTHINIHSEFVK